MKLEFEESAFEDLQYWVKSEKKKAAKILELIQAIDQSPFDGIGKPEPLKFNLSGCWSRRIDQEHRLVYRIENDVIRILSCRYHY
jgi:toxin YoeB